MSFTDWVSDQWAKRKEKAAKAFAAAVETIPAEGAAAPQAPWGQARVGVLSPAGVTWLSPGSRLGEIEVTREGARKSGKSLLDREIVMIEGEPHVMVILAQPLEGALS